MSDAKPLHIINHEDGEILEIYEDFIRIIVPDRGFWGNLMGGRTLSASPGTYEFPLESILFHIDLHVYPLGQIYTLAIHNTSRPGSEITLYATESRRNDWIILENYIGKKKAEEKERNLDYEGAIQLYESIGKSEDAKRVRKLKANLAAPKTEIHGDYVDDRDTIIKDSVINRSNVGSSGDDKFTKLKELKEMLGEGLISVEEFEKMKKEILGK